MTIKFKHVSFVMVDELFIFQLQLLEERHSLSRRELSSTAIVEKDECKDLSSALEEVHHKGTLMERLSVLENRVLQVSTALFM